MVEFCSSSAQENDWDWTRERTKRCGTWKKKKEFVAAQSNVHTCVVYCTRVWQKPYPVRTCLSGKKRPVCGCRTLPITADSTSLSTCIWQQQKQNMMPGRHLLFYTYLILVLCSSPLERCPNESRVSSHVDQRSAPIRQGWGGRRSLEPMPFFIPERKCPFSEEFYHLNKLIYVSVWHSTATIPLLHRHLVNHK